MEKTAVVNLYQVVRMSHYEPSRFVQDDFDTLRLQIQAIRRAHFSSTYAVKYDALMEPNYQALLQRELGPGDTLGAWWEITQPLCLRAGVRFRGREAGEDYDDRVDTAYSIGYTPEERKRLVDAYMADFYGVFGKYPGSIGAWVLDIVTLSYAAERYGTVAGAICRDQMGVDGFTLWGGWPNGIYYPSRKNLFLPAGAEENQVRVPVFRLLGPDPIYNFEADVRDTLQGVYTLETSWLVGRDPKWLRWFFRCLTEENTLGVQYAQAGQENSFLWENIRPGLMPQLDLLTGLSGEEKLRVEPMEATARWYQSRFRLTMPMTFQASRDWWGDLSCQWYACQSYRVGFLWERGHLRIRDFFLYDDNYASRYLDRPMTARASTFDALPVLFPQMEKNGTRPFIRLTDSQGQEPEGEAVYEAVDELTARCRLVREGKTIAEFTMTPEGITLKGNYRLTFDALAEYAGLDGNTVLLTHMGFSYCLRVTTGTILNAGEDGMVLEGCSGELVLKLGRKLSPADFLTSAQDWEPETTHPGDIGGVQPDAPEFSPPDSVFPWGTERKVTLSSRDPGQIRYTLDGTEPGPESPVYTAPIPVKTPTRIKARVFSESGAASETAAGEYRFGLKDIAVTSPTVLDSRPVFRGNGLSDLLQERRGSLDYLDGRWRGTLENLELNCRLESPRRLRSISIGFLFHHRSGVVYPRSVALYVGKTPQTLCFFSEQQLPPRPDGHEIGKLDVVFPVGESVGAFRLVAHRYEKMPPWCFYYGAENVFTMADCLIVEPEE